MPESPAVPITLEGSYVLHQLFRFNWKTWRALSAAERERIAAAAGPKLAEITADTGNGPHSALFSEVGHKGDLMFLHMRESVEALNEIELQLAQLEFFDFLEPVYSYLSIVELGLYESSAKTYTALTARDIQPHSPEWNKAIQETVDRQAGAMATRLYPTVPDAKYACFYPMDRKRGEEVNWYTEPMAERQRMMHEHGMIGRRYADEVKQIITGSIGLDDWEWGVDLFSNNPLVFKKLIYEMRFDEVSAKYALFGSFYVGIRLPVEKLSHWLGGTLG
ncbi:hydrogen peroxide-dependent heme synthase [Acidicapsa dinghuensis]|uniref:Hydrogen peroxide-dependent heme synthase n=1 Tax=Acidicapsa dinghuensis TaxID=2218256 RepID=A0ABW1EKP8_9BACT|nr:hydrogen peroxide-dependent heme synthase [Acidicapsa dinghuensis]